MKDVRIFVRFLLLAQKNFAEEQNTDFYAGKLGITTDELLRIIRDTSENTLSGWLKVMSNIGTGSCD